MSVFRLVLRNIAGSAFRSWVVALCAFSIAGLVLATSVVLFGARTSLRLAIDRLGADVVVVPEAEAERAQAALLTGHPARVWMPRANLDVVASVPGVVTASPQLYLASLKNASCCSVQDMFMIVFDPATDFVVRPWLARSDGAGLQVGEVVGGSNVFVPPGEPDIKLYGYHVALKAKMAPTGTGLDQTLFLPLGTALEMARVSRTEAVRPLEVPADRISAVMVKVREGMPPMAVALEIMERLPGTAAVVSPEIFQSQRSQLGALFRGVTLVLVVILVFSALLIGLAVAMAASERRRELGVLRALGATRGFVVRTLVYEAGLLALEGSLVGLAFTLPALFLFRRLLIVELGLPFLLPSLPLLGLLVFGVLDLTLLVAVLAAALPAWRASRLEPASAMRE